MRRFIFTSFCLLSLLFFGCSEKKCISIGRDPTWYPENLSGKTAEVNALTNVLIEKVAEMEKPPLVLIDTSWNALLPELQNGVYDAVLTRLEPNIATLEVYDFSNSYLSLGPILVVPINSPAQSLNDLNGMKVGISTYDNSVFIVQKHPSILIVDYQNMAQALGDLQEGKLGAVLLPYLEAQNLIPTNYKNSLKMVGQPLNSKGLRMVTLKGKFPRLLKAFDKALEEIKNSSQYERWFYHYDLK